MHDFDKLLTLLIHSESERDFQLGADANQDAVWNASRQCGPRRKCIFARLASPAERDLAYRCRKVGNDAACQRRCDADWIRALAAKRCACPKSRRESIATSRSASARISTAPATWSSSSSIRSDRVGGYKPFSSRQRRFVSSSTPSASAPRICSPVPKATPANPLMTHRVISRVAFACCRWRRHPSRFASARARI
jgi:hypothetical protein